MRKALIIFPTTIAAFIALVAALPFVLALAGVQFLTVTTGSMAPGMPVGSIIVVAPSDELVLGEPVTFKHPGAKLPVTHRVIALDGGVAATQGDANNAPDSTPVTSAEVIGKPVAQLDDGAARLFTAAQTVPGRIALGALIILLLMPWLLSKPKTKHEASDGPPPTTEPEEASA